MTSELQSLQADFNAAIETISTAEALKELESEYLGKKGKLKAILAGVKDLSVEEKKTVGVAANEMKKEFIAALEKKAAEIELAAFAEVEQKEAIDVTIGYPSSKL